MASAGQYEARRSAARAASGCRAGCGGAGGSGEPATSSVRRLADELDVPIGLVLEGGYDLQGLATSLVAALEALGADEAPAGDAGPAVHPLAVAATERLAERWPALQP